MVYSQSKETYLSDIIYRIGQIAVMLKVNEDDGGENRTIMNLNAIMNVVMHYNATVQEADDVSIDNDTLN